jgi:maltodextrin utilization protein YvdJ
MMSLKWTRGKLLKLLVFFFFLTKRSVMVMMMSFRRTRDK